MQTEAINTALIDNCLMCTVYFVCFVTPYTIFCYIIYVYMCSLSRVYVCPVTDVSQLRTLAVATGSGQQPGGGVSSPSADPWPTTHRTHQPSQAGQIYLHLDTRFIRTPQASYTSTCLRICNPVTIVGYSIVSTK